MKLTLGELVFILAAVSMPFAIGEIAHLAGEPLASATPQGAQLIKGWQGEHPIVSAQDQRLVRDWHLQHEHTAIPDDTVSAVNCSDDPNPPPYAVCGFPTKESKKPVWFVPNLGVPSSVGCVTGLACPSHRICGCPPVPDPKNPGFAVPIPLQGQP